MNYDIQEEKRAKNIIWTAAEDYSFEPLYLAFNQDNTADVYLNLIIGLVYKWYDKTESSTGNFGVYRDSLVL